MIGFERSIAGYSQLKNYEGRLDWYVTNDFDKPVKAPSAFSNAQVNTATGSTTGDLLEPNASNWSGHVDWPCCPHSFSRQF